MSDNTRIFNHEDAVIVETARVMVASLPADIDSFIAFDSTIAANYPELITTAIDSFMSIKTDSAVINEQAELTQLLNQCLAACNTSFKTIRFFVKKAYPNDAAVQKQFGLKEIDKARKNQARLIVFMENLEKPVVKYRDRLINAGINATVLDNLPTVVSELRQANTQQELAKKDRGITTQERIAALNELYRLCITLHEIAAIIYSDDAARLEKYSFPTPPSSNNNPDDLIQS